MQCSASPTVRSSSSPKQNYTCPINVLPSSFRDDPLTCNCRAGSDSEALQERNKSLLLVPSWTNPIWNTHLKHGNRLLSIPSCPVCSFSLIDSVDFLKLCFPGQRSGKAGGKSLNSSNSPSQTNIYVDKGEQNPTEKSLKQATIRVHFRSSSYSLMTTDYSAGMMAWAKKEQSLNFNLVKCLVKTQPSGSQKQHTSLTNDCWKCEFKLGASLQEFLYN